MTRILLKFMCVVLTLVSYTNITFSQNKDESSEFLFLIESKDNWIRLTGEKGCVFLGIGFDLRVKDSQVIDQRGMTSQKDARNDSKTIGFLINITRTNEGLILDGIKGTAWETLTINCTSNTCRQYIDQNGLVDKD